MHGCQIGSKCPVVYVCAPCSGGATRLWGCTWVRSLGSWVPCVLGFTSGFLGWFLGSLCSWVSFCVLGFVPGFLGWTLKGSRQAIRCADRQAGNQMRRQAGRQSGRRLAGRQARTRTNREVKQVAGTDLSVCVSVGSWRTPGLEAVAPSVVLPAFAALKFCSRRGSDLSVCASVGPWPSPGLGMANLAGAAFGAYPTNGGLTRSAVNADSGACTAAAGGEAPVWTGRRTDGRMEEWTDALDR
jgi:Sulfate permease family